MSEFNSNFHFNKLGIQLIFAFLLYLLSKVNKLYPLPIIHCNIFSVNIKENISKHQLIF